MLDEETDEAFEPGTWSEHWTDEVEALETALAQLEAINPRHARIVECRFFGGMTIEETAEALGLSIATVNRGWRTARAWLHRELTESLADDGPA